MDIIKRINLIGYKLTILLTLALVIKYLLKLGLIK